MFFLKVDMVYNIAVPDARWIEMNKYSNLASDLRQSIADGTYGPGDKLPTIPQLCEEYGVSKITVKRAMDELELQGLIARRRGAGTFVTAPLQGPQGVDHVSLSSSLTGFKAEHEAQGQRVSALVREFSLVRPDSGIAQELGLKPDEFCYYIERTLFADGLPLQEQTVYIPMRVAHSLTQRHAELSLYSHFENDLGLHIASAHRRVIAAHANEIVAKRLQIDTNDAVLKIFQTTFLDDGRPCEKSVSVHVPKYEFFSISTR